MKINKMLSGSLLSAAGLISIEWLFKIVQRLSMEKVNLFPYADEKIYSWWLLFDRLIYTGCENIPWGLLILVTYDAPLILLTIMIFFFGGAVVDRYYQRICIVTGYSIYGIYSFLSVKQSLWREITPSILSISWFYLRNTLLLVVIGLLGSIYGKKLFKKKRNIGEVGTS